jgi:hypothetical protein
LWGELVENTAFPDMFTLKMMLPSHITDSATNFLSLENERCELARELRKKRNDGQSIPIYKLQLIIRRFQINVTAAIASKNAELHGNLPLVDTFNGTRGDKKTTSESNVNIPFVNGQMENLNHLSQDFC